MAKIKYYEDFALKERITRIASSLEMDHVLLDRLRCVRSYGSGSRNVVARCHALPRIWQTTLGVEAHYTIEVISEVFDGLDSEQQEKTLIHELMHIPKAFGGGFRHHDYVCERNVKELHRKYLENKEKALRLVEGVVEKARVEGTEMEGKLLFEWKKY